MKYRLRKNRCPYCGLDFELVELYDGTSWSPTKICPQRHFALKFTVNPQSGLITYQPIANNSAPIPVPEVNLKYANEILSDIELEEL
jgi:hypothetical protein